LSNHNQIFRTVVEPGKPGFTISHRDSLISIGSCFSENIGKKFKAYKFKIEVNPFGQQYNPYSVSVAIERLLSGKVYAKDELVFQDELYHSFDHHGSFSRASEEEALLVINSNLVRASQALKKARVLFLTFGTSHVFSLKDGGKIVSNCHKISGSKFEQRLMDPTEIVRVLEQALAKLRAVNPDVKIILTVSPVRYFAFGHYENSVSKAHLFTAIYELQKRHSEYYYFPAYELVMDDLRDYRFFAEDMLHPNYQASNYVWESLCNIMLDKTTQQAMHEMDAILMAVKHRPRNPHSEAHKKFVLSILDKIKRLQAAGDFDFSQEEEVLRGYL
jgi:hypothetical protein